MTKGMTTAIVKVCQRCGAYINTGPDDIKKGDIVRIDMTVQEWTCADCPGSSTTTTK